MKTREEAIRSLIGATRSRAIRESIAALAIIFWFAHDLQSSVAYSPAYFGSILMIAAAGFIMGMLWCYTLTHDALATHPASDNRWGRSVGQALRIFNPSSRSGAHPRLGLIMPYSLGLRDGSIALKGLPISGISRVDEPG